MPFMSIEPQIDYDSSLGAGLLCILKVFLAINLTCIGLYQLINIVIVLKRKTTNISSLLFLAYLRLLKASFASKFHSFTDA